MADGHGGARPGAGRKPKREKYDGQITAFEDRAADTLPKRFDALELLADGGFEEIEETWEPAGLIYVSKQIETKEGTIRVSELAFPELPPEQLVCIRRRRSIAAPDRRANEYLVDRILGRPTQHTELTGEDGGPLAFMPLTDDQRAERAADLLNAARARRDGLAPDREPGELS